MARRKLPKAQRKVFRNIGIIEADYKRILVEDKVTSKGIAVIVSEALDEYFAQVENERAAR